MYYLNQSPDPVVKSGVSTQFHSCVRSVIMFKSTMTQMMLMGSLVLGGALVSPVEQAQAQQAAKIAVIDMNQAMNEVEEGKAAKASLEKRFAERKVNLEKKQKELQTMQEDLERKALVMSEE